MQKLELLFKYTIPLSGNIYGWVQRRVQQLKEDMRNDIVKGLSKIFGSAIVIDADELLDNIFYNNGKNFLLKRIKEMKG